MKTHRLTFLLILVLLIFLPTAVQAAAKPGAFRLISPASGAVVTTSRPALQWQESAGATSYVVRIRNSRGVVIRSATLTPAQANCASGVCTVTSPHTLRDGSFSWRAVARNRAGSYAPPFANFRVQIPLDGTLAQQVLTLVNQRRCAAGLVPLALESRLTTAAQGHSSRMAQYNFFSHTDPRNGSTMVTRVNATGYPWTTLGENIAAGQTSAQAVFNSWWNSTPHRNNMMNRAYREMGLGYAAGGTYGHYWTMVAGSRAGATGGVCP